MTGGDKNPKRMIERDRFFVIHCFVNDDFRQFHCIFAIRPFANSIQIGAEKGERRQGCSVLKSRGANIRCDALNALSSLAIYCVK